MGKDSSKLPKEARPGKTPYKPSEAEKLLSDIINMPSNIQRKLDRLFAKIPPRLVLLLSTILVAIGGLLWFFKFINDAQCLIFVMIGILAVRFFGFDHYPPAEEAQAQTPAVAVQPEAKKDS